MNLPRGLIEKNKNKVSDITTNEMLNILYTYNANLSIIAIAHIKQKSPIPGAFHKSFKLNFFS